MAKRRTEIVAASLLTAWTDSDTAMQVVGASLGVFGPGPLDPTVVLATETPLRNALFDTLLSLVEGGALELRATDDHHYAFRWRDDIAAAGLQPDGSTTIDLAVPSPYLAELQRTQAERDEALGRADFAEALAAERERQLRPAGVRSPTEPAVAAPDTRETPPEPPADAKPEPRRPSQKKPAKKPAAAKAPRKAVAKKAAAPPAEETNEVLYLTPPVAAPDVDLAEEKPATPEPAVDAEARSPQHRWSGYALDKSRKHLAGVDRLVDDG